MYCCACTGTLEINKASQILAIEEGNCEHVDSCNQKGIMPLFKSAFKLDFLTTHSRIVMIDDSTDGLSVSNVLNASPEEVVKADGNMVQVQMYHLTTDGRLPT